MSLLTETTLIRSLSVAIQHDRRSQNVTFFSFIWVFVTMHYPIYISMVLIVQLFMNGISFEDYSMTEALIICQIGFFNEFDSIPLHIVFLLSS